MSDQFCGHCGVQIPTSEVQSGESRGPGGVHTCSRHRGSAVATAEPEARPASSRSGPSDQELLFCSNCLVSIPLHDVRSGRARREYGSMLCAPCIRCDAGERAARREAVEAEMRADVAENDPLGETLRAARVESASPVASPVTSPSRPSTASRERTSSNGVLIAGVFLLAGVGLGVLFAPDPEVPQAPDVSPQLAALDDRLATLEERLARAGSSTSTDVSGLRAELRELGKSLRSEISREGESAAKDRTALHDRLADSQRGLAERLAKLEGAHEQLAQQTATLVASQVQRPPADPEPEAKPPTPEPPAPEPEPTVKPTVHPQADTWMDELLNGDDSGTRFAAASRLGRSGDVRAIPVLARALVSDGNYLVKRACTTALKELKAWNAVPMLIKALEDKEASVAHAANGALFAITGQDFGVDWEHSLGERKRRARKAKSWWEGNREKPPEGVSLQPVAE